MRLFLGLLDVGIFCVVGDKDYSVPCSVVVSLFLLDGSWDSTNIKNME